MNTTTHITAREELDYRENDGIQVALLWSRCDDRLTVSIRDTRTDDATELAVAPHEALRRVPSPIRVRGVPRDDIGDGTGAGAWRITD
jgi:hypothetical protein